MIPLWDAGNVFVREENKTNNALYRKVENGKNTNAFIIHTLSEVETVYKSFFELRPL